MVVSVSQFSGEIELHLFTSIGQLAGTYEMIRESVSIDLSDKQPGIYFLELKRDGQRSFVKLFKQ